MNINSRGFGRFGVVGVLLAFSGMFLPGIAGAAGAIIEVGDCLALDDNFARLACYDAKARAAARPAAASAPAAAPVAAPASVDPVLGVPVRQGPEPSVVRKSEPQAAKTTGEFGMAQPQLKEGKRGKAELLDRITELASNGEGGWSITLASGQLWRQNGSRRYNLRVGQEVRIYPSGWGDSYRLAVEELGSFIPVDRVR